MAAELRRLASRVDRAERVEAERSALLFQQLDDIRSALAELREQSGRRPVTPVPELRPVRCTCATGANAAPSNAEMSEIGAVSLPSQGMVTLPSPPRAWPLQVLSLLLQLPAAVRVVKRVYEVMRSGLALWALWPGVAAVRLLVKRFLTSAHVLAVARGAADRSLVAARLAMLLRLLRPLVRLLRWRWWR